MRFTVVTSGGEGDTRPLAALCRGLMDAGHEVRFFAEQSTAGFARTLGVPTQILAGDMQTAMSMGDPMQDIRLADVMAAGRNIQAIMMDNAVARLRAVAEHAQTSDAVLFSSLALFVGPAVAQELKKTAIGLWLQPITPTREFAAPMMPPRKFPGWINLLTYRLLHSYLRRSFGKGSDSAREQAFGTAPRQALQFDFPLLYGISPSLLRQPQDWPPSHQLCGHWSATTPNWQPPTDLLDFLAAGPPPIYVGFGSGSSFIRKKRLTPLINAIGSRRALFFPGWSKIDATVLPKHFFVVQETPHDWLFPQTSMVIHHGGAGTTHTASRAGVPSIVLPLGADQHFWASAVANVGVAHKYIKGCQTNSHAIATMIAYAERHDVRERAKALGAAMAKENGVTTAVHAIVDLTLRAATRPSRSQS
jgi:UDP:flavonoid glycosyltransferase YjiC (YdhE family)